MHNPKRVFYSLDGIRAVAAFMVVLFHTAAFFGMGPLQESYLAVDLFFALSGVVICHTYENRLRSGLSVPKFAWIRAVRIYPLYIAGTLLSVLALALFEPSAGARQVSLFLPLALVLLPNLGASSAAFFPINIPAWSLFLEFAVNLAYARVVQILNRRRLLIIMAISAVGLLLCMRVLRPHSLSLGWRQSPWRGIDIGLVGGFFRVGYSFFAGVFLYHRFLRHSGASAGHWYAPFVPWILLSSVAVLLSVAPGPGVRPYFDFLAVVAVFPLIVYAALRFQPGGVGARLCKFGGAVSYALYAIHYPLSTLTRYAVIRFTGMPIEHYAPWGGIAFVAVLLFVCVLLDYLYDSPLRAYLLKPGSSAVLAQTQNCQ
jgi:peptidoglycan/LPS O-acetylase OafA/YrhL